MRTTIFILLLNLMLNISTGRAQTQTSNLQKGNDPALILKMDDNYDQKVVRVSFDGVDGPLGSMEIVNSQTNRVVKLIPEFEIVSVPYYATVDIGEFGSGDYTFTLKTKVRSYSTTITIQ